MNLQELVSIAEDGPWCGTKPPGHPPRPHLRSAAFASLSAHEASHTHPVSPELAACLWQSIQLYQAGQRLQKLGGNNAELGGAVGDAASGYFDDTCGSVPWSVIIYWLTHNPPPPPPWLQLVNSAVDTATLAAKIGGDICSQLQNGARTIIKENLPGYAANAR